MSSFQPFGRDGEHGDVAFWLPPGGHGNGVPATYWAELADLDRWQAEPVLAALAAQAVGGYVAIPGGERLRPNRIPHWRLWVDSLHYHRAENILMRFLADGARRHPGPDGGPAKAPDP